MEDEIQLNAFRKEQNNPFMGQRLYLLSLVLLLWITNSALLLATEDAGAQVETHNFLLKPIHFANTFCKADLRSVGEIPKM